MELAMILERYTHTAQDPWIWSTMTLGDIPEVVSLAERLFQCEIDSVFTPDPPLFARNLAVAVIKQTHNPLSEQLLVARDRQTQQLLAYTWLARGTYTTYSPEEIAEARFAHVELTLSTRHRIRLLAQMLQQWWLWCSIAGIPVLVSTTIREEQRAFMHLHESAGFTVNGSYAYLSVHSLQQTDPSYID